MSAVMPFTAILGQEPMKNALIWNVVNPQIGGVLLSGEKGTAKSTAVRALAALLRDKKIVELPLNVTEDRLVGSIDLKAAVQHGQRRFEPGILYTADENFLYIDEVNLLSDHIVNSLLEAAASGVNRVEREGISYSHPSRFILVGSMNPEEGKLRPQFLDRFGLYVEIKGETREYDRAEIIRRRIAFEADSGAMVRRWEPQEAEVWERVRKAVKKLEQVEITDNAMKLAATVSEQANCAGHRAELVIVETARAIAALDNRTVLNMADIRTAASYALPHRLRDVNGLPPPIEEELDQASPEEQHEPEHLLEQSGQEPPQITPSETYQEPPDKEPASPPGNEQTDDVQEIGEPFVLRPWLDASSNRIVRLGSGRRIAVKTSAQQGRYVRAAFPRGEVKDIAFDATLRAAAPHQRSRDKNGMALNIRAGDLRTKVREKRTGNSILFVVDASGSMGANQRMKAVKGAICSMLNDAYQKRDKVGMIAFRNQSAEVLLKITRSVDLAQKCLASLPTGGRTPMGEGLRLALESLKLERIRDKDTLPVLVLISDGRANASAVAQKPVEEALALARKISQEDIRCIVIDTERDYIRLQLAQKIADAMRADYFKIEDLSAEQITGVVTASLNRPRFITML